MQQQQQQQHQQLADVVLKLGGSCITDKGGFEAALPDNLQHSAQLIAQLTLTHSLRCVVVHGAGSYGHPHAKAASLTSGVLDADGQPLPADSKELLARRLGFARTRLSVESLSNQLLECLVAARVPAVLLPPASHWRRASEWPKSLTEQLTALLNRGFVPVLHGDAVLEDAVSGSWTILGGDSLIAGLAAELNAPRAVFVSEQPGLFATYPPLSAAEPPLPRVSAQQLQQLLLQLEQGGSGAAVNRDGAADVTGAMLGKLRAIAHILHTCPLVLVCLCDLSSGAAACTQPEGAGTRFSAADLDDLPVNV